jgi:hypothetical protein
VHLDVEAERRTETAGEELHPLEFVEGSSTGEQRLEAVLVLGDGAGAAAVCQLEEGVGAQRQPIAQVKEFLELTSGWDTFVRLDLDVPQLRSLLQIVGGHPNFLLLHDALLVEIAFAPINEDQGIRLAIIPREIHLLESRWSILVVLAHAGLGAGRGGRRVRGQALDRLRVSLDGGLQRLEGLGQSVQGRLEVAVVAHGSDGGGWRMRGWWLGGGGLGVGGGRRGTPGG